ncbi:MAG: peptide chain release factor N(5)-glutamine methyltransferase [Deltaproteobacteria bacterium]|nr:peptide chain release factor N(5)-glutamine methyltransferase [Deltaproteobacteria bacterium]
MSEPNNTTARPTAAKSDEPWTVGRLLGWLTEDLRSRQIESPRLEAELLLGEALACDRIRLIVDRDRVLEEGELARLRALVQRRRKREPVAYLRGEREFYGRSFRVDRRVLVPRPDTETLVEVALRRSRDRSMFGRLLDLCTGSGNVAISFARERPTWRVDGTDLSEDALAVARDNAMRLGALWNVRFKHGDLFQAIEPHDLYEVIIANPPYIPRAEIEQLAPDIREHEPRMALDGGEDGLDLIRLIASGAPAHLVEGGLLAMEIGVDQPEAVQALLQQAGFCEIEIDRDLASRPRVVSGVWPGAQLSA